VSVRILVVSNLFPPAVLGGYEVECAGVVEHLRRTHEVHVLTSVQGPPSSGEVERTLPWLEDRREGALRAPRAAVAATAATRRTLAAFRPELVFVWNGSNVPQAALQVLHGAGEAGGAGRIPIAYRVCEHWFSRLYSGDQFMRHLTPGERGLRGVWARGARLLNRAHPGLRLDPARVAPAAVSWVSDALRRYSPAPPAIRVTHEEVLFPARPDTDRFAAIERRPDPEPRVLFAGRIEEQKGPEVAVRALAALERDHGIAARLAVAGDGAADKSAALDRLARELGVADRVERLGRLGGDALAGEVARAHVWLVPSVWEEPAPTTCVEAALARVPVVAARVGGIPEMLDGGAYGLLFERADAGDCARALAATLRDAEATARRVGAARERAEGLRHAPYLAHMDRFLERSLAAA
jgi:glycosyltransferase involved in cell wall biosynthesis